MPEIISLGRAAKRAGLREGDELVSLGGVPVTDVLDCLYHDAEESFDAEVIRAGKRRRIRVKKRADEPLDIELDAEMRPMRCKNKCLFCFVDQLPKGMRDSLYVKDDDYRFSFISGSYVTLTNLSEEEVDRMIRLRLSPIYISVHAYDDDVRRRLVSNPASDKLIGRMRRLGAHGIKMHTQIVVVPGINDGEVLERSIRGLHDIEGVETVAVVPVGLTAHREGLADLRVATREGSAAAVALSGGGEAQCRVRRVLLVLGRVLRQGGAPSPGVLLLRRLRADRKRRRALRGVLRQRGLRALLPSEALAREEDSVHNGSGFRALPA